MQNLWILGGNDKLDCFYYSSSSENECFGELIELVKKAFEQTHMVSLAMQKYQTIEELINGGDKQEIWDVMQAYLRQNASFINQFTWLTNLEVHKV